MSAIASSSAAAASRPDRLVVPALCQPSLLAELPSADAISVLLAKHIPPHLRPVRDTSGLFHEEPDLGLAARTNAWRRIAVFARDRIIGAGVPAAPSTSTTEAGANDVSTVLRWWNVRLQALLRLRLYPQFRLELESLWAVLKRTTIPRPIAQSSSPAPAHPRLSQGDAAQPVTGIMRPQVRYARLVDSPVVPFSLHVLRAREPILAGDPRTALEKCHALLQRCRVMHRRFLRVAHEEGTKPGQGQDEDDAPESIGRLMDTGARAEAALWDDRARRLTVIIAFILLDFEDYSGAVALLRPLISRTPSTPTAQAYNLLMARLFLEAGAVNSAAACIQSVSDVISKASSREEQGTEDDEDQEGTAKHMRRLVEASEALLAVWRGDYADAEGKWRHLLGESGAGDPGTRDHGTAAMVNNLALSTFYQGQVEVATGLLEQLLQDEPSTASSAEAVIFNLITMHELRSDDSLSHKRRILVHVAQWAGDGVGTSCLKLA